MLIMGLIIYFVILYVLYFFWNKNSKKGDDEGNNLDNKVLGWIIIAYIIFGFIYTEEILGIVD